MATISEALQGLSDGLSEEAHAKAYDTLDIDQMQARHRGLISGMLPKMAKIQREMRGRRYKQVQAELTKAVEMLNKFQDEQWPIKKEAMPAPPEWMDGGTDKSNGGDVMQSTELASAFTESDEEDMATTTTAGETDEESRTNAPTGIMEMSVSDSLSLGSALDDDPQTREPMHDAVHKSVEAFVLVLLHPGRTNKATENTLDCLETLLVNRYISGRTAGKESKTATTEEKVENGEHLEEAAQPPILHMLVEGVTKCSESNVESIQNGVVKTMLSIMTSPKCGIHEATMLMSIRATFHVYLITKSPDVKTMAKDSLYDMLKSVFNRMEALDALTPIDRKSPAAVPAEHEVSSPEANGESPMKEHNGRFATQYHTDAYLLFRALCKLSSKALPGDEGSKSSNTVMSLVSSTPVDPLALNSKILSLELLQVVLEYSGPAFCTGEKFVYAIQNYLCVSLLKNCMSNNTQVAYFSLKIFLSLVQKFKAHLKSEIEVFMSNIFLRVLESPNSSFEQKALVLEALRALSADPSLLTQLFLHYDCDEDAVNLYREIVHNLTRLSGKATAIPSSKANSMTKKELEQDLELSLAGVEVLVTILKAFLKALGLPGGEDEDQGDSASARLRKTLHIDVGLAATPSKSRKGETHPPVEESISTQDFKETPTTSEPESPVKADAAGQIVNAFEKKRAQQQNFEIGSVKFTLSLKGGLKYFIEHGFVELDAKQIALFFLQNKDKLDKTQMGEALGREPDSSFVKEEGVDAEKGGPGFWFRILNHYVDAFDFTGLLFDDAIRQFQSGFRLPGEAQKIDRIMEKFAERFTRQNLDVFPSADTAFILAFSVIMLNTDLHNPNIKEEKKMTIDSFIRNNRGIADGADLPEDFLRGIFDRIKSNPFSLKEDDEARERVKEQEMLDSTVFFDTQTFFGGSAEDRKREKFKKEKEQMMSATEVLFKKRSGKTKGGKITLSASAQLAESIAPRDVVKPMFDVTWGPLIGIISQLLESSNDERSIAVCLNGFVYAVRIAAHSDMSLARDTFVNSLAKFTFLGSIKEMKPKNIESIRTLLSIAVIDGEYLNESWGPVLQCISQLARLRLFASGLDSDESFLADGQSTNQSHQGNEADLADGGGLFRPQTKAETERETEETNSRAVVAALNEVLIDKVFSSTVKLSAKSIAHFIEQLVAVSASEIAGNSKRGITGVGASTRNLSGTSDKKSQHGGDDGPRIFSLQRLVEVADYNMDVRPRLAWAQVWEIMANHFAKIGCHENSMVSIFAIDSLKQLSFKFLEKPERSEFNFQRIFLRPFLQIMENNKTREDIRELILRCIDNMIRTMSHNLRSGWKVFFSILTASASDSSERINTLGLAILQRMLDEHLHQLCRLTDSDEPAGDNEEENESEQMTPLEQRKRNANVEDFVGLCRASLSFVQTDYSTSPLPVGLSMRALCHTACYADLLADGRVLPPVSGVQTTDPEHPGYTYEGLSEEEALQMVLWRTLLDGLATGVRSTLPSSAGGVGCLVQRGSTLALRSILLRHGHLFTANQWRVIFSTTLVPALQASAESDGSPVVAITSETPAVSSLDFLAEPQQLPPPHDDEGMRMFANQASSEESAPKRPLGQAELLVEASFTDMRHGGDGNLSRAYELAKKDMKAAFSEQPFPDSWIATTAPLALGTLTDICTEIILKMGEEARKLIWPIVLGQIQNWIIGRAASKKDEGTESWQPCEALVRVACRELHRFPRRVFAHFPSLAIEDRESAAGSILHCLADTLSRLVAIENSLHKELVRSKLKAYGISSEEEEGDSDQVAEVIMYTPYGRGKLVDRRSDVYKVDCGDYVTVLMNVIKLENGGTLYRPAPGSTKFHVAPEKKAEDSSGREFVPISPRAITKESWWETLVPALKVRCVGVYCLQHYLYDLVHSYLPYASKDVVAMVFDSLNESRIMAGKGSRDEDLSHAFQEAMFSEWGDGVEEVEEVLSNTGRLSLRRGSEMFFLTQESGATNIIVHMLANLYRDDVKTDVEWDRFTFSEPLLIEQMADVLQKFLDSESRDGHLIDPNVWRNASESGGKLAIYCTAFAVVVVNILNIMLKLRTDQFQRHRQVFFPFLCRLVRVQSDEIRQLVQELLERHVASLIDVSIG